MSNKPQRRIFLRGLGGACVAAPFLGSIGARSVKAEAVAAPKRLIVMFTPYGCITDRFFPTKSDGALTAADLEPTTLKPLAPYVEKLLMPRGIRAMNEWTTSMSLGQGNDMHLQVMASYFTCQPVSPNSNDPFSFASDVKFNAKAVGQSLDHVMAQQLSVGGTPLFMRVGNVSDSPQSAISYSAPQTIYNGMGSLTEIYASLTGLFQDGPVSPDSYAAVRGKSVLDLVRDDLDTLERFDMSQADKEKLEAWKALLVDTTDVVRSAQCSNELATALGVTADNVAAVPTGIGSIDTDPLTTEVADGIDGADLYSNLAVLAAVCNANPVIWLKYPGTYVYGGLGINLEVDSLNHRIGNAGLTGTCSTGVIDQLLTLDDYYARKFANLVGTLDGITEGDGTVLDNCAAVWFHEVSDGCARNLNNLPIVQAGSAGGYFKTGGAVNVWDGSADMTAGNSEYYCGQGGTDMVTAVDKLSGTDASLANAPINKYYCNLMNALGVKAGEDGFAAKGGTEQVSKFGMYDKTEDFIGGGTKPPMIHDPGEFTALKA